MPPSIGGFFIRAALRPGDPSELALLVEDGIPITVKAEWDEDMIR